MIWHFVEVWLLMLAAFTVGCMLGSGIYSGIRRTAWADGQGRLADSIGDLIDGVKGRLGMGPSWRTAPVSFSVPNRLKAADRHADRVALERPFSRPVPSLPPPDARQAPAGDDWEAFEVEPERRETVREDDGNERLIARDIIEAEFVVEDDEDRDDAPGISAAALPPPPPPPPPEPALPSMRPLGLSGPRNGVPDDLQRIRGIGRKNEELLNGLGIYHFSQIAAWTPAEARWVAAYLAFPERIERDDWIGQATVLGSGGDTGLAKASSRRREGDEPAGTPESGT